MKRVIGQQGECKIFKIDAIPEGITTSEVEKTQAGDWIISHSERGHHHVIGGGCDVMERTNDVPQGMQILYAIVKDPDQMRQDAQVPHDKVDLDPGIYEFRIAREWNPFIEQARRVAD